MTVSGCSGTLNQSGEVESLRKVNIIEFETLQTIGEFLRLDSFKFTHPLFKKGAMSSVLDRVNVHRGDSVAGILHVVQGDRESLLLVEQFRLPTLMKASDGQPDMARLNSNEGAGRLLELIAGMRKPGEPWLEAFLRECEEETNIKPAFAEHIGSFYPSPGACSEQVHLYYARSELDNDSPWPETDPPGAAGHGDSTEDIRRHFISPSEFFEMIENGILRDGKCFVAAEWMRRPENWKRFNLSERSVEMSEGQT